MKQEDRTKIGIIGDEDTLTGFMVAGCSSNSQTLIPVTHDTSAEEVSTHFKDLTSRTDVAIVLLSDFVAEKINDEIKKYSSILPAVMVIPSSSGARKT